MRRPGTPSLLERRPQNRRPPGRRWDPKTEGGESEWCEVIAGRWKKKDHINVTELRALLVALRVHTKLPAAHNTKALDFCDSQVVVAAAAKGRSSARPLLRLLRQLAALSLASGIEVGLRWIETARQPADGASRQQGAAAGAEPER